MSGNRKIRVMAGILVILGVAAIPVWLQCLAARAPGRMALTFDDGYTNVEDIFKALEDRKCAATMFLPGVWFDNLARNNPELITFVGGMLKNPLFEAGSHSFTHPHLTALSSAEQEEEIEQGAKRIERFYSVKPRWFRPPFGEFNTDTIAAVRAQGQEIMLWDVDSRDWSMPETESGVWFGDRNLEAGKKALEIVDTLVSRAGHGKVVLLHFNAQTLIALPEIVDRLRAMGYEFANLTELDADKSIPAIMDQERPDPLEWRTFSNAPNAIGINPGPDGGHLVMNYAIGSTDIHGEAFVYVRSLRRDWSGYSAVVMDVFEDRSWRTFHISIADSGGEIWYYEFYLEGKGWKTMTFPLNKFKPADYQPDTARKDGKLDKDFIYFVQLAPMTLGKGELEFRRVGVK